MSEDQTFVRMQAILDLEAQLQRYEKETTPHGQQIYRDTLQRLKRDLEAAIHAGDGDWFTERYRRHFWFELEDVDKDAARESARKGQHELDRRAARKAVDTKGPVERSRATRMRNWTVQYGKNDAKNPYSKANYYRDPPD
jgi:hypothetical protein